MEYKRAKKLKTGDVVEPRSVDIDGKLVEPHGNYIVKHIAVYPKEILITIDNGQVISHRLMNTPCIMGSEQFYCSWFGYTKSICHTNLTKEQLKRAGVACADKCTHCSKSIKMKKFEDLFK